MIEKVSITLLPTIKQIDVLFEHRQERGIIFETQQRILQPDVLISHNHLKYCKIKLKV